MKIFLSSTYEDLIEHRQVAAKALGQLDLQVRGMEIFGARPVAPPVACLSEIEDCELFVGIYAHRYGYIPHGSAESITEAEFRHEKKLNKQIFCFVVDVNHSWSDGMIEGEPGKTKLMALKAEISSNLMTETFTTPENLALKIVTSISRQLTQASSLLLPSTQMQIISPSHFGRLNSKSGLFALLLRVKFRNESAQPVLLKSFRIQYAGNWYEPQTHSGNVFLYVATKIFSAALRNGDTIMESLRIPKMDEIERHTFFIVPNPPEAFPGPERLRIIAEATFVQRSPLQLPFTLTDQGEIEEVEGIGN
jgi:Domain of unknown function (DUF4062)